MLEVFDEDFGDPSDFLGQVQRTVLVDLLAAALVAEEDLAGIGLSSTLFV